jgi:hypothetical protein
MVIDILKPIQASNKFMSVAVDESHTTYKRLIPVHRVTKPNKKRLNLLFTRRVSLLQNLQNNSAKMAIITGSSSERTDLITQLPPTKHFSWIYKSKIIDTYYYLQRKFTIKKKFLAKLHYYSKVLWSS